MISTCKVWLLKRFPSPRNLFQQGYFNHVFENLEGTVGLVDLSPDNQNNIKSATINTAHTR